MFLGILFDMQVDNASAVRQYIDTRYIVLYIIFNSSRVDILGVNDEREMIDLNPLSESTYLVLLSLHCKTLHGYGIIKEIEEISDGAYTIAPGTLYGVLKNLEKQGLIETVKAEKDSRKKKTYKLTNEGKDILDAEFERYQRLIYFTKKILDE